MNLPKTSEDPKADVRITVASGGEVKASHQYPLYYHKSKMIDMKEIPYPYPHLSSKETLADSIQNPQMYLPIYQRFFELNDNNYQSISLNHQYHIKNLQEITTLTHSSSSSPIQPANVFIKYSPLLDPIKYMVGKYNLDDPATKNLPTIHSTESDTHPKILSTSNASYVDGFFYYLTSVLRNQHNFVHGIDFYGSYLGIQDNFKVNIEEDLEYLSKSPFFIQNIGKLMILENYNQENSPFSHTGSRGYHPTVSIDQSDLGEQIDLGIIDIVSGPVVSSELDASVPLAEKEIVVDVTPLLESDDDEENLPLDTNNDSDDDSDDSKSEHSSEDILSDKENEEKGGDEEDDDDDWETEDEDEDEHDSPEAVAYIHDFPVQMIFLEKCHGTMDELLTNQMSAEEARSALFQIIMILLVYQKLFKFTHNDLHTNNIMFIHTDLAFLKYKYRNHIYCVPTYGRIFKIIDYGRSIYKYSKLCFCSDSFAPGGDASTQYNCEPFFKSSKPRLNPNMSFDLCRLGCSIFDFLFDDNDMDTVVNDDLKRTIQRWCTDDDGKNVLYKRNGSERYPGFKLYKMIARTVHQHTPESQLTDSWFKIFNENDSKHAEYMKSHQDFYKSEDKLCISQLVKTSHIMDIDSYPEYA